MSMTIAHAEQLGRAAALAGDTRHANPFHILREANMHAAWERARIVEAPSEARKAAEDLLAELYQIISDTGRLSRSEAIRSIEDALSRAATPALAPQTDGAAA